MASPLGSRRALRRVAVAAAAAVVMACAGGGGGIGGARSNAGMVAAAAELPMWQAGRNQFAFTPLWDFTDEFSGRWLNKGKWQDWNPHWYECIRELKRIGGGGGEGG